MTDDKRSIPGDFEVIRCDLPAFVGDFAQMDYGDPLAPRTVQVREEYRLDGVVAGYDTEFAAQCALKRWVRSRWDHGWSLKFNEVQDALDILRAADRGEHFNCGFYNRVFVECCRSLGWVARPVGVGVRDIACPRGHNVGNVGHSVPEVWSNEFRKWIIMDPDLNVHYERDGVPLSALEIHDAWLAHEAKAVTVVQEEPIFTPPQGEHVKLVSQLMPNMDHFNEEEAGHIYRRFGRHAAMDYYARVSLGQWTWLDRRCLPSFVVHFAPGSTGLLTSNPADLYWTVNMVRLSAAASWADGPKLAVKLEHCMPWFEHYEARVDGGAWQPQPGTFDWPMREGENVLEVRAVNVCGQAGIVSRLEVAYAPAKW
ncbi:MAG: transglutaminase-like domain-containing protein [Armatimonadetes bacterium]|nr:transglutaminase-like domain-containing protein [Armatimonadota bacterium]